MLEVDIDKILPLTEARDKFSKIVGEVEQGGMFILTKNGKPAVALINVNDLEKLIGQPVSPSASRGGKVFGETPKPELQPAPPPRRVAEEATTPPPPLLPKQTETPTQPEPKPPTPPEPETPSYGPPPGPPSFDEAQGKPAEETLPTSLGTSKDQTPPTEPEDMEIG